MENYGWNVYEGLHTYSSNALNRAGHLVTPVTEYGPRPGLLDHGRLRVPRLEDRCVERAICLRGLLRGEDLEPDDPGRQGRRRPCRDDQRPDLSSFGVDTRGELYATSLNGTVYAVTG